MFPPPFAGLIIKPGVDQADRSRQDVDAPSPSAAFYGIGNPFSWTASEALW